MPCIARSKRASERREPRVSERGERVRSCPFAVIHPVVDAVVVVVDVVVQRETSGFVAARRAHP